MSRIGNKLINIPEKVTLSITDNVIKVKGPKGELEQVIDDGIEINQEEGTITLSRKTEQKRHKAMHGLYRSLIDNMLVGVSEGYKIQLELVGVGYKASVQGSVLDMSLGYSHNIIFDVPKEISISAETQKGKNPVVTLEGYDKQLIGQVAAKIRALRKIEPYKGKGVRFVGEQVRRKAGKTAAK
ncbi:MAG: 50S ribosomal protein L6 [Bacteroidota bacterium]